MGKNKELARALAESQASLAEFTQESRRLEDLFEEGQMNSTQFLIGSMKAIHKNYCATNGLPQGNERE